MRRPTFRIALLTAFLLALPQAHAQVGSCFDPTGACMQPCPAEGACFTDADCPSGFECAPCNPATLENCSTPTCTCIDGEWACAATNVNECVAVVPASSDPTVVILALALLLLVAAVGMARRRLRSGD